MPTLPWQGKTQGEWVSQSAPTTAWQQAGSVWQRWRQDPEVRATWWKVFALLGVAGNMLLSISVASVARRATVEPYYVYVSPTGEVLGTEKVAGKPYSLDEQVLQRLAREWLGWVRSIPLDAEVLKANWGKAMQLSTEPVANRLMAYAKAIDLNALAKRAQERELAVKVVITNVLMLSERTLRITWTETIYNGANVEKETARYTGEFEFIVKKPTNQKEFDANPLGVWMGRFTWGKDAA